MAVGRLLAPRRALLVLLCRAATGRHVEVASMPDTAAIDLRLYVTDARLVQRDFGWRPTRPAERIVADIHAWLDRHGGELRPILG